MTNKDFTTDWEKMYDFWLLDKGAFLHSYSYLTEEEYDETCMATIGHTISESAIPVRDGMILCMDFEEDK